MSPVHEIQFISIFISFVILCMLTVKSVIFGVCNIAAMNFKFITCDKDEWSFQNLYIIFIDKPSYIHISMQTKQMYLVRPFFTDFGKR